MAEKKNDKNTNPNKATQHAQSNDPAMQAAIDTFTSMLASWQIHVTPAVLRFIRNAAQQKMSTTAFLLQFRTTKLYAHAFPGNLRKDGTVRMSEAQWLSGYNQARDVAGSVGRNFSKAMYGVALANNNSPSEIKDKIAAVDRLKTYAPELQEYNDYLLSTGQIKKPLTRKELQDFVMGNRKDLEWGWKTSHAAMQMQQLAGVDVGTGQDVSHKELQGMLKRFEALGGDANQIDFKKMGALISEVIPKNDLYGAGISKRDIVNMMLDGKNAPDIAKRVQRVMDTYEAAVSEPAAHGISYAGKVSLGTPHGAGE